MSSIMPNFIYKYFQQRAFLIISLVPRPPSPPLLAARRKGRMKRGRGRSGNNKVGTETLEGVVCQSRGTGGIAAWDGAMRQHSSHLARVVWM